MREIKFRLRDRNVVVGYERWNSLAGKWCYDTRPSGIFDIRNSFIPHTDKDQYTGLKDKKRVEIYEGDIANYYGNNVIVKWDEEHAMFYIEAIKCEKYPDDSWSMPSINKNIKFEVIGNIYENPELLKDDKT